MVPMDKLTEISISEGISLKVAETTNQLLAIQNKSAEKGALLNNANTSARFDGANDYLDLPDGFVGDLAIFLQAIPAHFSGVP